MEQLPHQEAFLLHLQHNNYSERTVKAYTHDLTVVATFLADTAMDFQSFTRQTLDIFKGHLKRVAMLDIPSINRILAALRKYIQYLHYNDLPTPLTSDAVSMLKVSRKLFIAPPLQDILTLVESPTRLETNILVAVRNRAMLETLLATGMRISELVGLNRIQIDSSDKLRIIGKGRKERHIYITPRALTYISAYIAIRDDSSPALFIPMRGGRCNGSDPRISTQYLQSCIVSYRNALGLKGSISAHSIRHAYATALIENGAPPSAVQTLLGHSSLQTTSRYIHISDTFAEESQKKFHPFSN